MQKKLLKYSNFVSLFIYIVPTFLAALLSIFAASVYLRYLDSDLFANFLIQHLIITFGTAVLSLHIGKITMISIKNFNQNQKKEVIFSSYILNIILGLILSYFFYLFLFNFVGQINLTNISIALFFGTFFSCIFVNLEDIAKGYSMNKSASFFNFFFMNGSITVPALLLFFYNNELIQLNLFNISVFIKVIFTIIFIIFLYLQKKIKIKKIKFKIFLKNLKQNLYLTGEGIISQIYFTLDKYIIKIQFNSLDLIIYSLSQQLSSKLGILSGACTSVMFGRLLDENKFKKEILSANLYFCLYLCSFGYLMISPIFENLLIIFFGNKYNSDIVPIFKLFILINIFYVLRECLTSFLQVELKIKFELIYNVIILPFFLAAIYFGINYNEILIFVIIILIKELIVLTSKINLAKYNIINYKIFYIQILILFSTILLDVFLILPKIKLILIALFIIMTYKNFNFFLIKNYFFKKT